MNTPTFTHITAFILVLLLFAAPVYAEDSTGKQAPSASTPVVLPETAASATPVQTEPSAAAAGAASSGAASSGVVKNPTPWLDHPKTGTGAGSAQTTAQSVILTPKTRVIAAGNAVSGVIRDDGSLWVWGAGNDSRLGDGGTQDKTLPINILDNTAQAAFTDGGGIAMTTEGVVYTWGANHFGEAGNRTLTPVSRPTKVLTGAVQIAAGGRHAAILKSDGSLYLWGANDVGQVGNGEISSIVFDPVKVLGNVVSMSLGDAFSAAVTSDGAVYIWGAGVGAKPVKVALGAALVSAGNSKESTYYISSGKALMRLGSNEAILENIKDLSTTGEHHTAVSSDGVLYEWTGNTTPVEKAQGAVIAEAGADHVLYLASDGRLMAYGANDHGQLGRGNRKPETEPLQTLKSLSDASVSYQVLTGNADWSDAASDGTSARGNSKPIKMLRISTAKTGLAVKVSSTNGGWDSGFRVGEAGSCASTIQAVMIVPTAELAKDYDVHYRVQVKDQGWLGWAVNGAPAGTSGYGRPITAIQIKLEPKAAPVFTADQSYAIVPLVRKSTIENSLIGPYIKNIGASSGSASGASASASQ